MGDTSIRIKQHSSMVPWFSGGGTHTKSDQLTINLEKEKKKIDNNKPACCNLPP